MPMRLVRNSSGKAEIVGSGVFVGEESILAGPKRFETMYGETVGDEQIVAGPRRFETMYGDEIGFSLKNIFKKKGGGKLGGVTLRQVLKRAHLPVWNRDHL